MAKATYGIREKKNSYHFTYSGDLKDAVAKAKRDLEKEKENTEVKHWEWIRKKAETAIIAHYNRIRRIEAFIDCAERKIKESEGEQ